VVGLEHGDVVVGHRLRGDAATTGRRAAVAPLIECHDTVPRVDELRRNYVPFVAVDAETVRQDNGRPVAGADCRDAATVVRGDHLLVAGQGRRVVDCHGCTLGTGGGP